MKLKPKADMVKFLRAVQNCEGDVCFTTAEGDILNLKSQLSLFLFSSIAGNSQVIWCGEIQCAKAADIGFLREYLEEYKN